MSDEESTANTMPDAAPVATELKRATQQGLLPKNPNAFARFTSHLYDTGELGTVPPKDRFKVAGQKWKELPETIKEQFRNQAADGKKRRHSDAAKMNIRIQSRKSNTSTETSDAGVASTEKVKAETSPKEHANDLQGAICGPYHCSSSMLGAGTFGCVCVAVHRELGIKVAVKFYKEGGIKELEEELAVYRDLELFAVGLIQEGQSVKANHVKQHFLNVLLSGTEGPFPWMVLPKGSASLQSQVPSTGFSLGLCRRIIAQAVTALSALKEVGRLHLDVKATNFLLELHAERLIMFDFGSAAKHADIPIPQLVASFEISVPWHSL